MTLRDVANNTDVSVAYLSDLERAVLTNPTLDKLRGIADAVGVSIDDLLGEAGSASASPPRPSAALAALTAAPTFSAEISALAKRWRRDPEELRDEWVRLLDAIQIAGRRPTSTSDYLFIFESIRRALEA
jgi:transcriptional regulator with XRE-family HTH domain